MFTDPLEYFTAELQRLDLLLHREILRLRATYQLSLDEFRGLYISDEQVDSFINQQRQQNSSALAELTQQAAALHAANTGRLPADAPWARLAAEFALSPIEQDILLLALAPEIDLKYETLYAYLNNDITRKWPTCDLALRVLSNAPADKAYLRQYLLPSSTLFVNHLLCPIEPGPHASSLAGGFTLTPVVTHYLLGQRYMDACLAAFTQMTADLCKTAPSTPSGGRDIYTSPSPWQGENWGEGERALIDWGKVPLAVDELARLRRVAEFFRTPTANKAMPLLILEGRAGAGQDLAATALCGDLGLVLLKIDLEATHASGESLLKLIDAIILQSRLISAGLYLEGLDALFDSNGKPIPETHGMITTLACHNRPVMLACPPGIRWQELVRRNPVLNFRFPDPDYATRRWLWGDALKQRDIALPETDIQSLAGRFALNLGQIEAAVAAAVDSHRLSDPSQPLAAPALFKAAREQSDSSLGNLAVKVNLIHAWDDLILPAATLARIKELAAAIRYRHVVYSEWGFERRIATGKGVKALFAGGSGTGKTMTASVIAQDLDLDLYKIDLSGLVSKYIGETEKNLDKIFRAAQSSNAILFFDEADALFGKRSEVKDAHDRYANIEVAYLLQKVEDHEGVVILASNLSKNIDDAFSRRLHYVIDFPLPDENHREILWRKMFPQETPLGKDVDWRFLAKQFSIAGGDIKNVALDAAFLAAQDGQVVTMKQLIKAMARQMMKQGRIPSATDFKQFHVLIGQQD